MRNFNKHTVRGLSQQVSKNCASSCALTSKREYLKSLMKISIKTLMLMVLFLMPLKSFSQNYNATDVAAINGLINNNGLNLLPNQPATWPGTVVMWSGNAANYTLYWLNLDNQNLHGSVNLSGLATLNTVSINFNPSIMSLDLSNCPALETLSASNDGSNTFTQLNLSGCVSLTSAWATYNKINTLNITNCNALVDVNFDANELTSLNLSGLANLKWLYCQNNQLQSLDISNCANLEQLFVGGNQLLAGPFTYYGCTSLKNVDLTYNNLTSINFSGFANLQSLGCSYNNMNSINVSNCAALEEISCNFNTNLSVLNLANCPLLRVINCSFCNLSSFDATNFPFLETLQCTANNISQLTIANHTTISTLGCGGNNLTQLDVSGCTNLNSLSFPNNNISEIDLTGLSSLTTLACNDNYLTQLDISANPALISLYCYDNQLTQLEVSNNTALSMLQCQNNKLVDLDLTGLSLSTFNGTNQNVSLTLTETTPSYYYLAIYLNNPTGLTSGITYSDGILNSNSNAINTSTFTTETNISGRTLSGIMNFSYIANPLYLYDPLAISIINDLITNNGLSEIQNDPINWNFATWTTTSPYQLITINLSTRGLTGNANFSGLTSLVNVFVPGNNLIGLDISGCNSLSQLQCFLNNITDLDLSTNTNLTILQCYANDLTELDLSNNTALTVLDCRSNHLTELDLIGLNPLMSFQGNSQIIPLTLTETEAFGEYTLTIPLNSPTFGNSDISYSDDGDLISINKTVASTTFTVETNLPSLQLSGVLNLSYIDVPYPPEIITTTLPSGVVGTSYSEFINATGHEPIIWELESGTLPNGLDVDVNTGEIYGIPTTGGTFNFTIKAENYAGDDSMPFTVIIEVPPTITTTSLPNCIVGTYYNEFLTATGDAPITWDIIVGDLPDGLTFDGSNGEIDGTPTTIGIYTFTAEATNDVGVDTKILSIEIVPVPVPPTITTASLPDGMLGVAYNETLTATGDVPITWDVIIGNLPDGLDLDINNGEISGIPENLGIFTFTVEATNDAGTDTQQLTIEIIPVPVPPTITTLSLPNGTIGVSYLETLTATGDTPITWDVIIGDLPDGLDLDLNNGEISGIPETLGNFTFTVEATNNAGFDTQQLTIEILPVPVPPTIITTSLPDGTIGISYSTTLAATGDVPITWTISNGSLPNSWSLNSSTGEISGMPATVGTTTFTVMATNNAGDDTQELSITINAVPVPPTIITTTLPNGMVDVPYYQQLSATGDNPISWSQTSGTMPSGLTLSSTGVISGTPSTVGTFDFTVKATNDTGEDTKDLFIIINSTDTNTPPTIITTELDDGFVGIPYSQFLNAIGDAPITWYLDSGNLPNGINLYNDGSLSGTPTTAGTFNFSVMAVNNAGTDTQPLTIVIQSLLVPPTITTTTLPDGTIGEAYSQILTAEGTTPILWALESGNPPSGLTIYSNGTISGTPDLEGTFNFRVKATNNAGSDSKDLTIIVNHINISNISLSNSLNAFILNDILFINGLIPGETWFVYNISGATIYKGITTHEQENINLNISKGIYIVRSGDRVVKVVKVN